MVMAASLQLKQLGSLYGKQSEVSHAGVHNAKPTNRDVITGCKYGELTLSVRVLAA